MNKQPSDNDDLRTLGLFPGERIRASVAKVDPDGSAVLGMLGVYVRVDCRRPVRVGDELTLEVVARTGASGEAEIQLRCVEESSTPSSGARGTRGLDLRA